MIVLTAAASLHSTSTGFILGSQQLLDPDAPVEVLNGTKLGL